MKLSVQSINLLRTAMMYDGKKETDQNGNEVPSRRGLSVVDSAQRRHFFKNTQEASDSAQTTTKAEMDKHQKLYNKKVEELKKKDIKPEEIEVKLSLDKEVTDSFIKANEKINSLKDVKHEIEITDKTKEVVVRCFVDYGEEAGFDAKFDEAVEEIVEELGIK